MIEYNGKCRTLQKLARTNITKSGFAFIEALGVRNTKDYVNRRRAGGIETEKAILKGVFSDIFDEIPSLQDKFRDYFTEEYSEVYTTRISKNRAIDYLLSRPFGFFDDMISFCDDFDFVFDRNRDREKSKDFKLLKVLIERIREENLPGCFNHSLVDNLDNYLSEISGYLDFITA